MKFIVQDTFSIKKVLIFGGFGLCRFQHKVGMNSFPMRMNVISYGTNSFPWGMYSFRSKIPIVDKAPTRAFSWLKTAASAFTFKTLLRHYAKQTPVSQREIGSATQKSKGAGGLVSIVSYSRLSLMIIASRTQFHVERPWGQRPFIIVS